MAACLALAAPVQPQQHSGQARDTVSVDFPGGTLAAFVAAVREASGNANILLDADADKVKLPPLTLRNASVESALNAVGQIVDDAVSVRVETQRRQEGLPVHSVRVRLEEKRRQRQREPVQVVRVFSLRSLTSAVRSAGRPAPEPLKPDTILTAIDTGLELVGGAKATLRYHADSHLIFVRGTVQQAEVVEAVLSSLTRDLAQASRSTVTHTELGGEKKEDKE